MITTDNDRFILHEKGLGYYGGQHKKYHDMITISGKTAAKVLSKENALQIADTLNKRGYNFEIEPLD